MDHNARKIIEGFQGMMADLQTKLDKGLDELKRMEPEKHKEVLQAIKENRVKEKIQEIKKQQEDLKRK